MRSLTKLILGASLLASAPLPWLYAESRQYHQANTQTIQLPDGNTFTFSQPDITGRDAEPALANFYGTDIERGIYEQMQSFIERGIYEQIQSFFLRYGYDKNRDGFIHIANKNFFDPKNLVIYGDDDRGTYIATDGKDARIFWPDDGRKIGEYDLRDAHSIDDYVVLDNLVNDEKVYASRDLLSRSYKVGPDARVVDAIGDRYLIESPSLGNLFLVSRCPNPFPNENFHADFLQKHHQKKPLDDAYTTIQEATTNGYEAFTQAVIDPATKVLLLGEMHLGEARLDFLIPYLGLLKENGYVLGIEVSRGAMSKFGITADDFFTQYNAGCVSIPQDHGTTRRCLDKDEIVSQFHDWYDDLSVPDFLERCHAQGITIIPMEEEEKARTAYYALPPKEREKGSIYTRDYFMHGNILGEVKAGARVAMLVGRNHVSVDPVPYVAESELFVAGFYMDFDHQQPLGFRLEQSVGDNAVTSIGLYDDYVFWDWFQPFGGCETHRLHQLYGEVEWLKAFLPFTGYGALAFDPTHPMFAPQHTELPLLIFPQPSSTK
ncbi:hypothetical protein HYW21_08805 [Candidatus Woesearchaeota archaeon]|nr:hypothetical protein [Candidatus Woesearchaeota archaeon]